MHAGLPYSRVNSSVPLVCRHDLSNPRGRACRPSGKQSGEDGILSGVVPVYVYCPAFSVSVSLGVLSRHACRLATQPLCKPRTVGPGRTLAVRVDRAYSSLPTSSPAPSVIAD